LSARLLRPTGTVYVGLYLGESSRGSVEIVRVIESKEMDTDKIVFLDAGQMQKSIDDTGRVSLYGILFDFDRDTLKPESKPTLDEIAKLLETKPKLRLSIVGHTDDRGSTEYNMDLSSRRAASVVAALTGAYGVDPGRLSPSGAGPTAPAADNATEDGRRKNRRVELVAQ
jgi:OOP family OmpA-OmpF porin